jgi:carbon dioxide concentrating mechanism protein CcmO
VSAPSTTTQALGFIEIGGWSPAMVVLDAMEKHANITILQTELNDAPGVCIKLSGRIGDMHSAIRAAEETAAAMQVKVLAHAIPSPSAGSRAAYFANPDFNPLIEQPSVQTPVENTMNEQANFAVGLIETQGFTAAFEAIDTALKTANVEVLAREKLGGGYITIVIKGDVSAVRAAIDAGKARVEGLGKLIAAHVIASPSKDVLALLPK